MKCLIKENDKNCFVICKNKIFFITALAFIIITYLSISNILKVSNTFASTGPCVQISETTKAANYKCEWDNDTTNKKYKLNFYPMPNAVFIGRNFLTKEDGVYLKSGTIIINKGNSITIIGDTKIGEEYYKKLDNNTIGSNNIFDTCNQDTYDKISSGSNIYGIFSNTDIRNISKITTNVIHNNYKDPENRNQIIYKRTTNLTLDKGYKYCGKVEKDSDVEYLSIDNSAITPAPQITIRNRKLYKRCTTAIVQFDTDMAISPNNISLILYDENNKRIGQIKPTVNELELNITDGKNNYHEITLINLKKKTYYFEIQIKTNNGEITDNKYALFMNKSNMEIGHGQTGCFGGNITTIDLQ